MRGLDVYNYDDGHRFGGSPDDARPVFPTDDADSAVADSDNADDADSADSDNAPDADNADSAVAQRRWCWRAMRWQSVHW